MVQLIKQPEALLGWMGALGDQTRLRLLRLLEGRELGVAELCEVVQLPRLHPTLIPQHLQMPAHIRLRQLHHFAQFRHPQLPPLKQSQQPQPRLVPQRRQHPCVNARFCLRRSIRFAQHVA